MTEDDALSASPHPKSPAATRRHGLSVANSSRQSRILSACLLFAALCAVAAGQYLETIIDLAGQLGSTYEIRCVAVDPTDHTVYVGGNGWVGIVDGVRASYLGRVQVGLQTKSVCVAPDEGKLFVACSGETGNFDSTVYVIDCGSGVVTARVRVGVRPCVLAYDPVGHKVYCGNYGSGSISVIDARQDTVLSAISVSTKPWALGYNPQERKLYCSSYENDTVWIVDTRSDTVIAAIASGALRPQSFSYNTTENMVYFANDRGKVVILDGAADTLRTVLDLTGVSYASVSYNPVTNRAYYASDEALWVIDGNGDTALWPPLLQGLNPRTVLANPTNNRLYVFVNQDRLAVLDGDSDSLLSFIGVPMGTQLLCLDSVLNRVYATGWGANAVAVVDCFADTLVGIARTGQFAYRICYNPANDRIYTANLDNFASFSVIDASTNELLRTIPVGAGPMDICANPVFNKVYITNRGWRGTADSTVTVVDCATDTVLRCLVTGREPTLLCCNSGNGKVYGLSCDGALCIIDGATDSIRVRLQMPDVLPGAMVYNSTYDKLYVTQEVSNALTIVDGARDSVRAVLPVRSLGYRACYCEGVEKLYALPGTEPYYLTVVCGRGDSLIRYVEMDQPYDAACYAPRHSRLFMVGAFKVLVLDCTADTVLARLPVGTGWSNIAYDADNDKVYVTCGDYSQAVVSVIDAQTLRVVRSFPVNGSELAWCPQHSRTFVAACQYVVVFRDTASGVADRLPTELTTPSATLARGNLSLPRSETGWLLDPIGRRVMCLVPGPNDMRHLSSGVYFIRPRAGQTWRKVVCVR